MPCSVLIDPGLIDPGLIDPGLIDPALIDPGLIDPALIDPGLIDTVLIDAGSSPAPSSRSLIPRLLPLMEMSPSRWSASRCFWTVEEELRPTRAPTSRTVGISPFLMRNWRASRTWFCFFVGAMVGVLLFTSPIIRASVLEALRTSSGGAAPSGGRANTCSLSGGIYSEQMFAHQERISKFLSNL